MEKGSDGPKGLSEPFLFVQGTNDWEEHAMKKKEKKQVIAERKSCRAEGTGLSHYILMDKKSKK